MAGLSFKRHRVTALVTTEMSRHQHPDKRVPRVYEFPSLRQSAGATACVCVFTQGADETRPRQRDKKQRDGSWECVPNVKRKLQTRAFRTKDAN